MRLAKIMQLHSSLGNEARLHFKKEKKNLNKLTLKKMKDLVLWLRGPHFKCSTAAHGRETWSLLKKVLLVGVGAALKPLSHFSSKPTAVRVPLVILSEIIFAHNQHVELIYPPKKISVSRVV